jgi:UDP-N-acetylglucosamine 2-epimerase (non-hydrolysing)
MKVAPVMAGLEEQGRFDQLLVHTGQHYGYEMSEVFFAQLGLRAPDVNLGVGSGSHAWQTATIMLRFEETVLQHTPDLVLVYGDVNSTVAASLVCAKLHIPVGHVEAGLRSFDRSMPEETNRVLTDQIADLLFTPSYDADENLAREGVAADRIHRVGNVMIDSLVRLLPQGRRRWPTQRAELDVPEPYGLVTLHRPSNVDAPATLAQVLNTLDSLSRSVYLLFPVHPRTQKGIAELGWRPSSATLRLVEPMSYLDFLAAMAHATLVITDSGGIQEETTYLNVPCFTVRRNTERPITLSLGTNVLVGQDTGRLQAEVRRVLEGRGGHGQVPPLWDGRAGGRIAAVIAGGQASQRKVG